jgi:hypothetical protein
MTHAQQTQEFFAFPIINLVGVRASFLINSLPPLMVRSNLEVIYFAHRKTHRGDPLRITLTLLSIKYLKDISITS